MIEITIYTCVFLSLISSSFSEIIFVNEKKSWTEAHDICRDKYGGHLATININSDADSVLLRSCMTSDWAWFGNYSVVSPFIAIVGCFEEAEVIANEVKTLNIPSAGFCESVCQDDYFAVSGNTCYCLRSYDESETSLNAAFCDIRCDQYAYCGGNGHVNVYHSPRNLIGLKSEEKDDFCWEYFCYNDQYNTFTSSSSNCSYPRNYICDSDSVVNNDDNWFMAARHCIQKGTYLTRTGECIEKDKGYWNGYFRSEYFIHDTENIPEIPHRVSVIRKKGNDFSLFNPIDPVQEVEMPFLCQTSQTLLMEDTETLCLSSLNQNPITSLEYGGTTTSRITKHRNKNINASKVQIIAGIAGGCGSLTVVIIIVTVVFYCYRRNAIGKQTTKEIVDPADKNGRTVEGDVNTNSMSCSKSVYFIGSKDDTDNKSDSAQIYIDSKEGTYDHLHHHDNRRKESEDTYAHATLHPTDTKLYDVTSYQQNINHDNEDDYSRFEVRKT